MRGDHRNNAIDLFEWSRQGGIEGCCAAQIFNIRAESVGDEVEHMLAADLKCDPVGFAFGFVIHIVEMRIAMFFGLQIGSGFGHQFTHADAGVLQYFKVHFATGGRAFAGLNSVGGCSKQQIGNYIGHFHHVFFIQAALGHPGGAKADTRSKERRLIAGDGVSVEHNAGYI
ncbi:hypothetical protein SDC9_116646 [bioreactor metagenome]|uniref:Uncharacterized protein n=1 Tax=bioreactor metagenome TaxID=1076179 RepID=A0A645BX72_9ZZZZ